MARPVRPGRHPAVNAGVLFADARRIAGFIGFWSASRLPPAAG
ncbi:hypothetical protein [Protofrankia coriariae]|nr:hypothetical protein [Protofrankia coriariae]